MQVASNASFAPETIKVGHASPAGPYQNDLFRLRRFTSTFSWDISALTRILSPLLRLSSTLIQHSY
jgi:hypothetical protein